MPSQGNSGASNSTRSAPILIMETAFEQLEQREQEFIKDVIVDMRFDANGIKIPMKGVNRIKAIAEAMAICILESKRSGDTS